MQFRVFNLPFDAPEKIRAAWIQDILQDRPGMVFIPAETPPIVVRYQVYILVSTTIMFLLTVVLAAMEGRYAVATRVALPLIAKAINIAQILRPTTHPQFRRVTTLTDPGPGEKSSKNYQKGLIDSLLN